MQIQSGLLGCYRELFSTDAMRVTFPRLRGESRPLCCLGGRLNSWNVDLDLQCNLRQFGVTEKRTAAEVCPIGDHD
jgi:hypothetical protein